ncbi:MAG: hypothetical protein CME69_06165 [Halobacteriovorax sp.]|nr:hypothetical protein [Halobacteriovorax sp.]
MKTHIHQMLLALIISVAVAALENPWTISYQSFHTDGYFSALYSIDHLESEYMLSSYKNDYLDASAIFNSYIGNYQRGIQKFDLISYSTNIYDPNYEHNFLTKETEDFYPYPATEEIIQLTNNFRAVFINEAHHIPQHRALTMSLLKALYKKGFRYFAAETLNLFDEKELNNRKYPLKGTGFYSVEPVYADLIRQALKIGYTVISYEHKLPCNDNSTPLKCQNEREQGQARNLLKKTFQIDPQAKILVHAGYGHINEKGDEEWIPMARYFKRISGIDPLTIDQVTMTEHSHQKFENIIYTEIMKKYKTKEPIILKRNKDIWTGDMKDNYDVLVFNPRTSKTSRPNWLFSIANRVKKQFDKIHCEEFPCHVQAFIKSEMQDQSIPFDQFVIENSDDKNYFLSLDKSYKYLFKVNNIIKDFD